MTRLRRFGLVLVAVLAAACRTVVVEGAAVAPEAPVPAFLSLGPSDGPACAAGPGLAACRGPVLATSAQPDLAEFAAIRAAGYGTVVNFRDPGEPGWVDERPAAEAAGLRYAAIPVKGHGIEAAHADALDAVLRGAQGAPVLMHCRTGMRAKMAWTVWLARHGGLSPDDAMRYGERAGLSGEPMAAVAKVLR